MIPSRSFHILVVDDDQDTVEFLAELLTLEGYQMTTARNAQDALAALAQAPFDLALFDICLPGLSGLDLLERVRERDPGLPVILVTGQPCLDTAVAGLRAQAQDYVIKPFEPRDLRTRVGRLLASRPASDVVQCDELLISFKARQVWHGEREIRLAPLEFALLAYLVRRAGQVVTWDELLTQVWGCPSESGNPDMVRNCAKRLRRKIERDPNQPRYLVTAWGEGFRWEVMPVPALPVE